MANILEIILKATKSGSGFKDTEKDTTSLSKAAAGLNKILGAAGLALGAKELFEFGQASVAAARESAAAEGELQAALTSSGQASEEYKAQLEGLATALENTSLFTDEQVIKAQATLVTFKNLGQDVMPRTIQVVTDMGQKMGDMGSAAQLAGIALNAPEQAAARLQRQGIMLSETQKEQISTMVSMGDTAGAQGIILDALNEKFGGQAQAARDAAGGAQDYAVSLGRLQEAFGGLLLTIGDAGATDAATGWIDRLAAGAGAWTGVIENIRLLSEAQAKLAEESGEVEIAQRGAMGQVAQSEESYASAEAALSSLIGWFVEGETAQEGFAEAVQEVTQAAQDSTPAIEAMTAASNKAALAGYQAMRGMMAQADATRDVARATQEVNQGQLDLLAAKEAAPELGGRITEQRQKVFDIKKKQEEEAAADSERAFRESTSAMVKATNELGDQISSAVSGAVSQSSADIAKLLGIDPEGEARVNEGVRRMAAVATGGLANEWTQGLATQLKGVDAAQAFVNAVSGGNESAVKEEARKLALAPIVELFDVAAMATSIEQKLRGQDLNGQLNQRIQKILSEKGLNTSIDAISQVAQGTQEVANTATTSVGTIGVGAEAAGEQVKTAFAGALPAIDTLIARLNLMIGIIERVGVVSQETAGKIAGLNPPTAPGANGNGVPSDAQRAMGGPSPL